MSDGQDDLRNTHLPSKEEWAMIRQLYSETYPVKPLLAYILVQTEYVKELEAELAEWRRGCTRKHGSQNPCSPSNGVTAQGAP